MGLVAEKVTKGCTSTPPKGKDCETVVQSLPGDLVKEVCSFLLLPGWTFCAHYRASFASAGTSTSATAPCEGGLPYWL